MNISMEQQARIISLEGLNLRASLSVVTTVLPKFFKNVSIAVSGLMEAPTNLQSVKKPNFADIRKIPYAVHRKTLVNGPQGLRTDYATYGAAVYQAALLSSKLLSDQLYPFRTWVSTLLADPTKLNSQSVGKSGVVDFGSELKSVQDSLTGCINREDPTTKFQYGDLVRQNSTWELHYANMNDSITLYNRVGHRQALDAVADITSLLDTLMERIKDEPENYVMSGPVAAELSKVCLQMANLVEFYSITGFLLAEAVGALNLTFDSLKALR